MALAARRKTVSATFVIGQLPIASQAGLTAVIRFGRTKQNLRTTPPLVLISSIAPCRRWFFLLLHFGPGLIWIIFLHALCCGRGIRSEIFLEYFAVIVHDKRHNAGIAVLRRIGHYGKTTDHFAFDKITVCAARGVLTLRSKYPIVIAMIWARRGCNFCSIALASCLHHDRP